MIGQTLNHRYTIMSRLGEGGMGEVYLATDEQTRGQVAVKVLARQLTMHPESLERFRREAETLRQLDHPNIVKFVDAFEHERQYVIVMEHVPGGSLHDLIKAGPLPVEQAQQIALDLCDALIRAHRLNIIHRDIKPENILLAEDGTPKLADFGVARLSEGTRMTRSGTQVGTPYYMAPEAWEGKPLDAQADVWSLGVLLFEMLTGQLPFGGDTSAAVMNKVLTSQPPDLKKLRTDVPLNLTQIIKRMLTRDRKRRYPTMREVAVDLERGQRATTGVAAKKSKPIRWLPTLIGLGLVLAASTVWFATQARQPANAQPTPTLSEAGQSIATGNEFQTTQALSITNTPDPVDLALVLSTCLQDICIGKGNEVPKPLGIASGFADARAFSWSPDGKEIVFDACKPGEDSNCSMQGYRVDSDGANLRIFQADAQYPTWSPDGELIAFYMSTSVTVILPDGGGLRNVVNMGSDEVHWLAWSPDSQQIAWVGGRMPQGGWNTIWVTNLDGTNLHPIYFDSDREVAYAEIAWSPDGQSVVFRDGDGTVYEVDAQCDARESSCEETMRELPSFPEHWTARYFPQWTGELVDETPTSIPTSVTVFSTDFNSGVPPEFSGVVITESVQGYQGIGTGTNVFGGDFLRNSSIPPSPTTLTLTDLPAHTSIDLHFLLAIIDSWDGTDAGGDTFTITVDGQTVFTEVFDNIGGVQSYNPPSGVELVRRVESGFRDIDDHDQESGYDMGNDPTLANIPHTSNTLTIQWYASGSNWQGGSDESWAIDNLEVILK
jgi:serine/threonine protein kinase